MKVQMRKLQVLRRCSQIAVILFLLLIPAIARYSNYVASLDVDTYIEKWDGSAQGVAITGIDRVFRSLPGGETERVGEMVRDETGVLVYAQQFRGSAWSAEVAGVSMSDPLAAAESIVARKHIAGVVAISLIVPLAVTLLFGRVFCSWICPMGFLCEINDKLRGVLQFLEIKPRNIAFSRSTKMILLGAGLLLTAILSVPVLGYIYPPAIVSRELHDVVFAMFDRAEVGQLGLSAAGFTWMSLIIAGILLFELLISRRWWCKYVCPGGALYSLIGFARPIRVKLIESRCTHCTDCVKVCPMSLNPMNNKMGMECDNCGECISVCDDDALKYSFAGNVFERNRETEQAS